MSSVTVVDDFIDIECFEKLQASISQFSWLYLDDISGSYNLDKKDKYCFGFWNPVIMSGYTTDPMMQDLFLPIIEKIIKTFSFKECIRSRLDMTTINLLENKKYLTHVDFQHEHYSSILYLNDSDGDTIIYNEKPEDFYGGMVDESLLTINKRVSPKRNRLLVFDGLLLHTGHSPHKNNNRIILNSNFV